MLQSVALIVFCRTRCEFYIAIMDRFQNWTTNRKMWKKWTNNYFTLRMEWVKLILIYKRMQKSWDGFNKHDMQLSLSSIRSVEFKLLFNVRVCGESVCECDTLMLFPISTHPICQFANLPLNFRHPMTDWSFTSRPLKNELFRALSLSFSYT